MCVNDMNMIGDNIDEVRTKLLRLGFDILSCHEEILIVSKRFIYQSDIKQIENLIDAMNGVLVRDLLDIPYLEIIFVIHYAYLIYTSLHWTRHLGQL